MTIDEAISYVRARPPTSRPSTTLRARRRPAPARRCQLPPSVLRRPEQAVREVMRTACERRAPTWTRRRSRNSSPASSSRDPGGRRRGAYAGIVTGRRHRRRRAEEASEDIQKSAAWRRSMSRTWRSASGGWSKARRVAGDPVSWRNANGDRDGLLREGDRERGGAGAIRAADHQQRRQLRSQATTLVIRRWLWAKSGCATGGEIVRRELSTGFVLGSFLAVIGLTRILVWQGIWHTYGSHYMLVA